MTEPSRLLAGRPGLSRPEKEQIWYFPSTADARSRPLPPGGGVLDTGIVIGSEHAPGSYEIGAATASYWLWPRHRGPAITAAVDRAGAALAVSGRF